MDWNTPGLPVHHQLLELAQAHVHWVGDAIQPSHPLYPLLLHPSIFPRIRVFSFFFFKFYFLTLQYCIGFAIYRNESATGIHVFPILNPPPSCLPIPSLWVLPVHQPQASSIVHWTWTGDSFHIWYYTYFNAILPNHPTLFLAHRVQKTVLYISVFSNESALCSRWPKYWSFSFSIHPSNEYSGSISFRID